MILARLAATRAKPTESTSPARLWAFPTTKPFFTMGRCNPSVSPSAATTAWLAASTPAGRLSAGHILYGGPEHAFIIQTAARCTVLAALPGGNGYSNAIAINAGGNVTGNALNSTDDYRAFLYNGTAMQDLGTLAGFDYSWGIGINDSSEVVGTVTQSTGPPITR